MPEKAFRNRALRTMTSDLVIHQAPWQDWFVTQDAVLCPKKQSAVVDQRRGHKAIGGFARLNELPGLVREVGGLRKMKGLLEAMSVPETDTAAV